MFDTTSYGFRRIWPSPAHQATKALKYSHPGAAEWTPVPDSLLKSIRHLQWPHPWDWITSMRPCQREIQLESHIFLFLQQFWSMSAFTELLDYPLREAEHLLCSYHKIEWLIIHCQLYLTSTHTVHMLFPFFYIVTDWNPVISILFICYSLVVHL